MASSNIIVIIIIAMLFSDAERVLSDDQVSWVPAPVCGRQGFPRLALRHQPSAGWTDPVRKQQKSVCFF